MLVSLNRLFSSAAFNASKVSAVSAFETSRGFT